MNRKGTKRPKSRHYRLLLLRLNARPHIEAKTPYLTISFFKRNSLQRPAQSPISTDLPGPKPYLSSVP